MVLIGFAFWYFLAKKSALVTCLFDPFLDASAYTSCVLVAHDSAPPDFLMVATISDITWTSQVQDEKWEENANFQASIVVQVPVDVRIPSFAQSCADQAEMLSSTSSVYVCI